MKQPKRRQHVRQIQQRLPHPHEHDMRNSPLGQPLQHQILSNDFTCRQVTVKSAKPRRTKRACHRATHLAEMHAARNAVLIRQQHALEYLVIAAMNQQFVHPRLETYGASLNLKAGRGTARSAPPATTLASSSMLSKESTACVHTTGALICLALSFASGLSPSACSSSCRVRPTRLGFEASTEIGYLLGLLAGPEQWACFWLFLVV